MVGAFFWEAMVPKEWLSYTDQVELLSRRGMKIDDRAAAASFLPRVNYYRFSGYFRYWQREPQHGDNRFIDGTAFTTVCALYEAEQQLMTACADLLRPLEVLFRTRFAYAYGDLVGNAGAFARGVGFTQPPNPGAPRAEEYALQNLDQSKEAFVAHYRDEIKQGTSYLPQAYERMPIWVAVEALSFGSLSRLIAASGESGVLDAIAASVSGSRRFLPGQVRSFVYLRNRIAHGARLWNHSVLDVPGMQPKRVRQIKKSYRQFSDSSIYKVLVALDEVADRSGIRSGWLKNTVEPILNVNDILAFGIATPAKYGEMPRSVLVPSE